MRKMQSTHAEDIEMDKGNEISGPARDPKTPSASPMKQKIATSRRKGYGKAVREGSGKCARVNPTDKPLLRYLCHSGPDQRTSDR